MVNERDRYGEFTQCLQCGHLVSLLSDGKVNTCEGERGDQAAVRDVTRPVQT